MTERDLAEFHNRERLNKASSAIDLAQAFPVKGGNFVRLQRDGWHGQPKSNKKSGQPAPI